MLYQDDLISEFGEHRSRRQHLEDDLQRAIIMFLRWALPDEATAWHVPNGGKRHAREAARMSSLGVRPGVPDVHIVYRGRLFCMELKTPKGSLSEAQMQMHRKLALCGVRVAIVRNLSEAEQRLREWEIPLAAKLGTTSP